MRFLRLVVFTAFILCGTSALANTILGGNITWTCLGGNQYRIRLTTYLDCYGYDLVNGIPSAETVFFIPSGCGASVFSANLNHVSNTEISDLCASEFTFSSCSGGANQGVMQFVYEGVVTLAAGCQWNVIYNGLYWGYFDNANEFANPAYINSVIYTNFPCYDSPTIASTPANPQVAYLCVGVNETHQLTLNGLPAGYTASYSTVSAGYVMGPSIFSPPGTANMWNPVGIGNPNSSGLISWTPTAANLTLNGFRIEITIRDAANNVVGIINENMAFYVRDCALTNTQFTTPPVTSTGPETTLTGNNNISVCAGDSLIFTVSAVNSNPLRSITINHTPPVDMPSLVGVQQGNNQANKTFKLLTTSAHVGNHTLTLHAIDDACPVPDEDNTTINITVHPNVQLTFTDTTICHGDNVTLEAQGLDTGAYDWSINYGDMGLNLPDNQASQTVSPEETTEIKVTGIGIPASCQAEDTVIVRVLMTDLTYTKTDETCNNTNGSIDLTVDGEPSTNITYTWTGTGVNPVIQDQTGLNSGNYSVTVNETVYGCELTQTINIADIPAPTLSFTGTTTICEGDCTDLLFNLTSGSAPYTVTGTGGTVFPVNPPTASHSVNVCPASTTTYTATGITDASGCSTTINQSVTVTVRPRITASFAAAGPICLGQDLQLNLTYAPSGGGPYNVNYTITTPTPTDIPQTQTNFSGGTLNVTDPTIAGTHIYDIDSVSYPTGPACPSADVNNPSINVVVNPSPTATLTGGGVSICAGTCRNLTLTLTGTGPWVVNYTIGGVGQPPLNVPANPSPYNYTWNVCPTVNSTYCITSVQDANCTNSPIANQCATINVTPVPIYTTYTLSTSDICEGDDATINVVYGPAGQTACLHFTATPSGVPDFAPPFCSQPSGSFSSLVSPDETTQYCLDSIRFEMPSGGYCSTPVSVCRILNVNGDIDATQTSIECNDIGTLYRVTYTLSDGELPYSEAAGGGTGAFNPSPNDNVFVTGWVSNGASPVWSFTDANACNTENMSVNHTCPVLTEVGTMGTTAINVCGDGQATGIYNNAGEFLDGNDELMFILCLDDNNPIITSLQTNCTAPQFSFIAGLPMSYGTTYYIVAVVGDVGAPGCVNTNAANIQISNGTPVAWYQTPTATLSAAGSTSACIGDCVTLDIARTGQAPWTVHYTVDGDDGADSPLTILNDDPIPFQFCSEEDGLHELTIVESGVGAGQCAGTVSGQVDVTINPLPTATISSPTGTCVGEDYCFQINLTAGTGPWDVVIDNPGVPNDTVEDIPASTYNGYCAGVAGNYRIFSVTDANGCTNNTPSTPVTLVVHPLPVVNWVQSDTSFCEGATVNIEYAISGGATAPFEIAFNTPDSDIPSTHPSLLATGAFDVDEEGDYEIVSVTDVHGCESANGDIIHIDEIPTPIADAGPDLDQCVGLPITIGTTASGGQTYSWASSIPPLPVPTNIAQPTVTVSTVPSGAITYTVTAHYAQCTAQDEMLLTIHGLPSISVTAVKDSLCFAECTDLTASNNGTGTLTYEWTATSSIGGSLTSNIVQVCPTANETFEVTAYETHGAATCETTQTIDIVIGTEITVAEDFTEQVCFGTCAGEIYLTPSGGFPDYTIGGDVSLLSSTGLCPNTYNYTITDNIGCVFNGSILVEERPEEAINDITVIQPSCAYDLGQIQVNNVYTSYEITNSVCAYVPPGPNPNGTGTFTDVPPCAEPYTITAEFQVSPTEFCTTTTTVTIEPDSPEIIFNEVVWPSDVFCYDTQACFDASPTGGSGALDISWHSCAELNCEVSTAEPFCIAMQADTTLYGVATDANGCISNIVMMEAFLSPEIELEVQNGLDTTAICEGDCLDLVAAVSGGNNNIQITWFQVPNMTLGPNSPFHVCPVVNTTYFAMAFDGCSQEKTDTVVVVVHDTPEVLIDADIYEGCYPQTINFIDLSDDVPDNHTCVWNFGTDQPQSTCGDITFTYPDFGQFYPVYSITTEHGCIGRDTLDVPIIIYGKPDIDFSWEPQPVTVIDNRVQFINMTTAAVSYNWTVYGIGTSVTPNPEFVLPARDLESYEVCLEATTIHGCMDTLCKDVFMETVMQVFVPNAFTPDPEDENKINDVFLPIVTGHDPDRYKIWIMNRWGDTVFYSEDSTEVWSGNFDSGGHFVPDGAYVWHIECYKLGSNDLQVYQGTVTIIR